MSLASDGEVPSLFVASRLRILSLLMSDEAHGPRITEVLVHLAAAAPAAAAAV